MLRSSHNAPNGLLDVWAEAQPKKLATVDDLNVAFEAFKNKHEARYASIEAVIDGQAKDAATGKLGAGGARADDPEYSAQFSAYVRKGRGEAEIQAAQKVGHRSEIVASMSSGSNENGGYLAPTEWDRRVRAAQLAGSPMRRLANVVVTSVGAYSSVWSDDNWGSGWVGETASRPLTTTPALGYILFGHGEIYAQPAITQRLLDDASFDLENWVATSLNDAFSRQENIAFIGGDGVNKPFGLLQYITGGAAATQHPGGVLAIDNSGAAAGLTYDGLTDFIYKLPAPYRQNASWLMSSVTAAMVSKLKDLSAFPIWRDGLTAGQPATLMGYPVEIDENMPTPVANNLPIAFGDFQAGYVINDRQSITILRDPYTNKPFVNFYSTKRVGGGVADPKAIRLLKLAA